MLWVLVAVVGWLICSLPAATLIGGAIARADSREVGTWSYCPSPDRERPPR